jgi:LmbE family N-acetylglucosaminyl deacetylase
MSKKKHNLVIVAHPDDESLFFAGAILAQKKLPWHAICVTDGNADGHGQVRKHQFEKACKKLGIKKISSLNMPDRYTQRLDIKTIKVALESIETPNLVFTHGPVGEYGHPHHQDVSMAVHEFYNKKCEVIAVAHNCMPDKVFQLTTQQYKIKSEILSKIYFSETERFINFVPATPTESFAKFTLLEVQSLYQFFTENNMAALDKLKKYKWFKDYLTSLRTRIENRPF